MLYFVLIVIWINIYLAWRKKHFLSEILKIKDFSYTKFLLGIFFLVLSLIFAYLAYFPKENSKFSTNTNVVFVLDVSKSMNSIDINLNWNITTRLNLAKKAIEEYVKNHPNFRYWLVIFAKQAQPVLPLTDDINVFLNILSSVDWKNIADQWTNFNNALKVAIERFKNYKWKNYLVFISDWWDKWDFKWLDFKFPSNIKSYVFWVGTKTWWKIFLGFNDFYEPIFQKYKWKYVITYLNEENLKALAKAINAKYYHLKSIYDLEKIKIKEEKTIKKEEKLSINWYIFLSFVFLLLGSFLNFKIKKWEN